MKINKNKNSSKFDCIPIFLTNSSQILRYKKYFKTQKLDQIDQNDF